MSYTYLQGPGEESSAASFSDIPASVLSNGTHTPGESYSRGSGTTCYRASRFGMMSRHSTASRGKGASMLLRAVSRVRTYRRLARVPESTAQSRECGDTWPESLARYDRASCLWKTAQCSLLGGWESYSETWPRWGPMRNGACWALPTPVRLTSENASGSWPTPTVQAAKISECSTAVLIREYHRSMNRNGAPSCLSSAVAGRMWPTPVADGDRRTNYAQGGTSLRYAVRMWPTPTAQDAKNNGAPSQMERNTKPLNAEIGGALNPPWVEWLMGWPIGWTGLQPLETVKYRQWLRSHGAR